MKWFEVYGFKEIKFPEYKFFKTKIKAENELMAKIRVLKKYPNQAFINLQAWEIKMPKLKNKGQFTIISLIAVFLTLILFSAFYPMLNTYLSQLIAQSDSLTAFLLQMIPAFIAIAIILTIVFYVIPHRE